MDDAYFLANELNAKQEFLEMLSKNLTKFLNAGQLQQVMNVLVSWTFESTFPDGQYLGGSLDADAYNTENGRYNAILDGIANYAYFNEDYGTVKKVLKLYRPLAKSKWHEKEGYSTYSYDNSPKDNALKKAKAEGVKL